MTAVTNECLITIPMVCRLSKAESDPGVTDPTSILLINGSWNIFWPVSAVVLGEVIGRNWLKGPEYFHMPPLAHPLLGVFLHSPSLQVDMALVFLAAICT
jgi:hypothetical protein